MYNHHLDAFILAAEKGSFTKAASLLYITPSALVQQINLLEKHLGTVLFVRSKKGVTLTPSGFAVYEAALQMRKLSDETRAQLQKTSEQQSYTVTILRLPTTKYRYLNRYIDMLRVSDPFVSFDYISFGEANAGQSNVLQYLDVSEGVFMNVLDDVSTFIKLFDTPLCVALPRSHPLFLTDPVTPEDLAAFPIVMLPPGMSQAMDRFRARLKAANANSIISTKGFYTNDTFQLCREEGYALITPAIWQDIHPGLSVRFLTHIETIPYGIAFYHPINPGAEKLKALIEQDLRL